MGLCPCLPLDLLFSNRFQSFGQRVVLGKYHQVVTGPTGRGRDEAVEAKKSDRGANLLRLRVVTLSITGEVDAERREISARGAMSVPWRRPVASP